MNNNFQTQPLEAPKTPELLTVHEVAKRLRVDDTTVRRWIKQGVLKAVALPHRNERTAYRVKAETLEAMIGEE